MDLSPLILLESVIMAMQLLSFLLYLICCSFLYISSLISLKAGKVFLLYAFRLIINSPRVSLLFFAWCIERWSSSLHPMYVYWNVKVAVKRIGLPHFRWNLISLCTGDWVTMELQKSLRLTIKDHYEPRQNLYDGIWSIHSSNHSATVGR